MYEEDCAEARSCGERKPKKPKAVPREATPTKYKRSKDNQETTFNEGEEEGEEEREQEAASSGDDDDSYVE
jgi:hypothetical protein